MDISQIDRNFAVQTSLDIESIRFYNVLEAPFSVYGVFYDDGKFRRIPEKVAKCVNEGVLNMHARTAGGRVRFITNSPYVAIHAKMPTITKSPHFALTGSAGFDLYIGKKADYHGTFVPPLMIKDGYESVIRFPDSAMREVTINFPLYSEVSELYIGLDENAKLKKAPEYKHQKPIVYYGSSITQGGCASRPGNSYENVISRALQTDYINLGFSGSAKAEDEIAEYIKGLDMSVFVYDYDHNAPSPEHLEATHQRMFQTIRKQNPELPIVILSRPCYKRTAVVQRRLAIISKTYDDAIAAGDKNVYLFDGPTLMQFAKNNGTVDGCHPNDLGFHSMAKSLIPLLRSLI